MGETLADKRESVGRPIRKCVRWIGAGGYPIEVVLYTDFKERIRFGDYRETLLMSK